MPDDSEDEFKEPTRALIVRRTTKLELGLAVGLAINFGGVVAFATTMVAKVDQVTEAVDDAVVEIKTLRSQAPEMAVLRYRVEQLEKLTPSRR